MSFKFSITIMKMIFMIEKISSAKFGCKQTCAVRFEDEKKDCCEVFLNYRKKSPEEFTQTG